MKMEKIEVPGKVDEDVLGDVYQTWDTVYDRSFHGVVDTIEEVKDWIEKNYEPDSGKVPYAVKGEEIFFNIKEERTVIKRKAMVRKRRDQ